METLHLKMSELGGLSEVVCSHFPRLMYQELGPRKVS